jgi:hypothetical protein
MPGFPSRSPPRGTPRSSSGRRQIPSSSAQRSDPGNRRENVVLQDLTPVPRSRRPRCRCCPAARNTRSRATASVSQAGPQCGKADGRLPAPRADETPERGVGLADYRFPVAALDADQDCRGLPMPCDHDAVGLGVVDALLWALLKASNAYCLHRISSVLRPGAFRRTARTYTIRSASATS